MKQYLDIIRHVLEEGTRKENRTGVDTLSTFAVPFKHDLQAGFPLLTTKKMHFKSIVAELCWFLRGDTNVKFLEDRGVRIWREWADDRGEIDAGYGEMWRHYPHREYVNGDLEDRPFDQMKWAIEELKKNPMNRRIVINAWHPPTATKTKMSPCHYTFAFNVQNVKRLVCKHCGEICPLDRIRHCGLGQFSPLVRPELCLHWTQRSADSALGVPFNIASYALLTHIVAKEVGLPVGLLAATFIDCHIYTCKPDGSKAEYDHVPALKAQLNRIPRPLPTIKIADKPWDQLDVGDVELLGYNPYPALSMKVAV